jgi:predicted nucleic acid-binding protein
MPNAFVDTNILLYTVEAADQRKTYQARQLILKVGNDLVTSTQVLQEFYTNATRKLRIPPPSAVRAMESICRRKVIQVSPTLIFAAIDTSERYRLSFWDCLIVEAAVAGSCEILYTEDLNHGQKIRGVLVQNPFL